MKKIIKLISVIFFFVFFLVFYLSIFGIETNKLNNQIISKFKNLDNDLELELKEIKLLLDPFKFRVNSKTIGSKIKYKKKTIELENIKTQISLRSIFQNKFSLENLEISTKSLEIQNLTSFLRAISQNPKLYIFEKIVKKGYLIADLKFEFDNDGKIKESYKIKGFIKDAKIDLFKSYDLNNINLNFNLESNNYLFSDIKFSSNTINFFSNRISVKKNKNDFLIQGIFTNKILESNKKFLEIIKPVFPKISFKKISFDSKSNFSLRIDNKFDLKKFQIESEVDLNELSLLNQLNLIKIFPEIKEEISFFKNKINIRYEDKNFEIKGKGNISIQNQYDYIEYIIKNNNDKFNFETSYKINKNPLFLDFLNFKKNQKLETLINIKGYKDKKNKVKLNLLSLNEANSDILIKDLLLDSNFKIMDVKNIKLNYLDKDNKKNSLFLLKKNKKYNLTGSFFNADKFIENLLFDSKEKKSKFFSKNFDLNLNIKEVRMDKQFNLQDFAGNISFKDNELFSGLLIGNFSNQKKLKLTINNNGYNKITTLFLDYAEPIVGRYKFIKGFDGGILDFSSEKNNNETISKLKIYDFRLKEVPALTKILTLASLQGIADILTGEGIRFDEFEMKFRNKGNLMTIDEIYAIGPAISILMNGYSEKNQLISLRGTLVPATTINKAIGSIPVLGKILVGSKTGEGVFGVSFKIKGPPKNLETTVNPIKTLTPRFITRTLEKIKNN